MNNKKTFGAKLAAVGAAGSIARDRRQAAPRLSLRKRLRIVLAALTQTWHEKTCAECGSTWMAIGTPTELIAICDACEVKQMDVFTEEMNRRYPEALRGAELEP